MNFRNLWIFDFWDFGNIFFFVFGMLSVSVPRVRVDWVWVGWFCWVGCGLALSLEYLTPELVGTPSREYLSGVNTLSSHWCITMATSLP